MSVNSTSLHHQNLSTVSDLPFNDFCYVTRPSSFFFATYHIVSIIIFLPLCTFILHRGFHQWRQRSSSSSSETLSHTYCFTYHLVVMELMGVVGYVFFCYGIFRADLKLQFIGNTFTIFVWYGELFFHVLTCGERYLAVVHPRSYLKLGKEKRIRIRNISIVCVWLLSFLGMGSGVVEEPAANFFLILDIFQIFFFHNSTFRLECFGSPCFDSSRTRRTGQHQEEGWPIKAESILHYCDHPGSAGVEVYMESGLGNILQHNRKYCLYHIVVW